MSMLKSLITLGNYLLQHQNGIDVRWTAHVIEEIKQQHDAALEAERERNRLRPIGDVRREFFLDGSHPWNGMVRDVSAQLEQPGMLVDPALVLKELAKRLQSMAIAQEFSSAFRGER